MSTKNSVIATSVILILTSLILNYMGRLWICSCNYISLWHPDPKSSGNSQHIGDFYTFSHILHGVIFYYILNKFFPKLTLGTKFLIAVLIEAAWEILENSPIIINRYREQALAQGYNGDSIVNAVADIFAMILGFYLAKKLKTKYIVILFILFELGTLLIIRDNLTLNVIQLIKPIEFIGEWQANL